MGMHAASATVSRKTARYPYEEMKCSTHKF
jgi:hypothetical protein